MKAYRSMPIWRSESVRRHNNEFTIGEAVGEFKCQTGAIGAQYNAANCCLLTRVSPGSRSGNEPILHGSGCYYGQNEA